MIADITAKGRRCTFVITQQREMFAATCCDNNKYHDFFLFSLERRPLNDRRIELIGRHSQRFKIPVTALLQ